MEIDMNSNTKIRKRLQEATADALRIYAEAIESRDEMDEENLRKLNEVDTHHQQLCKKYGVCKKENRNGKA